MLLFFYFYLSTHVFLASFALSLHLPVVSSKIVAFAVALKIRGIKIKILLVPFKYYSFHSNDITSDFSQHNAAFFVLL